MPDQPLVTVGLPVYNGARYIDETISSILNQDVAGLELVISDNGSTDETVSIIKRRSAQDERIRPVFRDDNLGAAWNFNNVLTLARGEYFHWAGSDDLMEPSMLRRCIEALQQSNGSVLAYPRTVLIDENGNSTGEFDNGMDLRQRDAAARMRQYLRNFRLANPIFGVFPTAEIRAAGGLGSYPSADLVTLARLALRGPILEVPEPLFRRRMHKQQSWQKAGLYEGFAHWFDTSRRQRLVFTDWRVFGELLRACTREKLPFGERLRCLAAVLYWWPRRRWKRLLKEPLRIASLFRRGEVEY
jgi:glycosyltransferase involved in cell wall biosynthesis